MTELLASRYEVLDTVGRGGQGVVLKARDHRHERLVALKVLEPRPNVPVDDLLAEAGVLLRVRPHSGLPIVRDDFFIDDRYAIVMDWIEGEDLGRLVAEHGEPGLPLPTVLDVVAQTAAVLDHLHSHDPPIVHGDVKPSNLIVRHDGAVVLVDFGVATIGEVTRPAGTHGYLAPEIAAGGPARPESDVYGLAATAVTLLTGRPPSGENSAWSEFEPGEIGPIARTLRRALATDPARRPTSAGALAEHLRAGHRSGLPGGIFTFLATGLEESLWDAHPDAMTEISSRLGDLICEAVESSGGRLVTSTGADATTLSMFPDASTAVAAATALHERAGDEPWPGGVRVELKVALHTGEAEVRDGQYIGATVHRVGRLRMLAAPGSTVVSQATAELLGRRRADGIRVVPIARAGEGEDADPVFELADTGRRRAGAAPGLWLVALADAAGSGDGGGGGNCAHADVAERHRGTIVSAVEGVVVMAFVEADDSLAAALELLESSDGPPRVGVHFEERAEDTWAIDTVTSAGARAVCLAAHRGQILVSAEAHDGLAAVLTGGATLLDWGRHRLTDLAQPQRLFQIVEPARAPAIAAPRSLDGRPHNLPVQLTRFIGRQADAEQLVRSILANRLVTITGTGGAGKTRLALHAVAETLDVLPDGVWFADLSRVVDSAVLGATIAAAIGVQEGGAGTFAAPGLRSTRSAEERLVDHFADRDALLVLDGCEAVLDACRELTRRLIQGCPRLRIVATSRRVLDLPGEAVHRVGPLALPDPDDPPDEVRRSAAVCLFVDRAMLRRPDLVVDDDATRAIASICRQVDGIPLAIELAAARTKMLALPQIATMLEDRLGLLVDDSAAASERQATVRGTIEWSYATLTDRERILFRRLAVFAGGFTLEAAQHVCGREGLEHFEVLDLLGALVDKSLVETKMMGATVRYRLLDATRQYAAECARDAGDDEPTRDAHVAWAVGVAERAELELGGGDVVKALASLDEEDDNLCAAMTSCDASSVDDLRIAASLSQYWLIRGRLSEGRDWIERSLARCPEAPESLRGRALFAVAMLACFGGDYERTDDAAGSAIALSWGDGGRRWGARSLSLLGLSASGSGDVDAGERRQEEALAASRACADPWAIAFALNNLGNLLALRGASGRARSCYEEALDVRRAAGDTWGIVWTQFRLGVLATWQGEIDEAILRLEEARDLAHALRYGQGVLLALLGLAEAHDLRGESIAVSACYEEALTVARVLEEPTGACIALAGLALAAVSDGALDVAEAALAAPEFEADPSLATRAVLLRARSALDERRGQRRQALAWAREALLLRRELGDARGIAEQLEQVALLSDDDVVRARLLGAAASLRERCGYPVPLRDRTRLQREFETVTADDRGASAYAVGRGLSPEEASDSVAPR